MLNVSPNTATVRLTVTIVRGDHTDAKEFAAEVGGTTRPVRGIGNTASALRDDAWTWIRSLDESERPEPTRVTRVPLSMWQRIVFAVFKMPHPVRLAPAPAATEPIAAGEQATAAVSMSVDSSHFTDTISVAGNTNGSPYTLARELSLAVVSDMRDRLETTQWELERHR